MWTSTWLDAEALPAQPEMVIEPSTVVRSGMVTSVGLVPVQPGGPLMVNENVGVWVLAEEVPVRVTGYVPTGVVVAVVMVLTYRVVEVKYPSRARNQIFSALARPMPVTAGAEPQIGEVPYEVAPVPWARSKKKWLATPEE